MKKKEEYWYPWTISAFRRDTAHMTTFQRGIYRELIDFYMETKEPIINSDIALANIARVTPEEFYPHALVIRSFFKEINGEKPIGKLLHTKCEAVLADQAERTKTYTENGVKGGRPKGNKINGEKPIGKLGITTRQDITRQDRKKEERKKNGKERKSDLARHAAARGLVEHESALEIFESGTDGAG